MLNKSCYARLEGVKLGPTTGVRGNPKGSLEWNST